MNYQILNEEHLKETVKNFKGNRELQLVAMAHEIIFASFGYGWLETHVIHPNQNYYFFIKGNAQNEIYKWQHRIVTFSDRLWALKNVTGYKYFINSLKTQDLESTIYELEIAYLLLRNGYEVSFIERILVKGHDYDLQTLILGEAINVEAKTKRQNIDFNNIEKLPNTLNKARKQLPKKQAGIVFIQIPIAWINTANSEQLISQYLENFFRNTTRVIKVVFTWDEVYMLPQEGAVMVKKYKEFRNINVAHKIATYDIIKERDIPYVPSFYNVLNTEANKK